MRHTLIQYRDDAVLLPIIDIAHFHRDEEKQRLFHLSPFTIILITQRDMPRLIPPDIRRNDNASRRHAAH